MNEWSVESIKRDDVKQRCAGGGEEEWMVEKR
jgi:hypothetical protein